VVALNQFLEVLRTTQDVKEHDILVEGRMYPE
jgi:hypothetical protein